MLYSRPQISPLGWILQQTPTPNGSKNYDAMTVDGRPVDFRFSSGWLTVKIGPQGSKNTDYALMETIIEQPIAPFGTMHISPDQLADILGLTFQEKVPAPDKGNLRSFDWSGETTALQQFLYASEAGLLSMLEQIESSFANIFILQTDISYTETVKEKKGGFLKKNKTTSKTWTSISKQIPPKEIASTIKPKVMSNFCRICIDPVDGKNLQDLLKETPPSSDYPESNLNVDDFFKFTFGLGFRKRIAEQSPFKKSFSSVEFPDLFELTISKQYSSHDTVTDAYIRKLLSLIDTLYFNSVDFIDLETNNHRAPKNRWEKNYHYFSNDLKVWCEEKPNRYLNGFRDQADSRTKVLQSYGLRPSR